MPITPLHTNMEVEGGSILPQKYQNFYQKNLSTPTKIQSNIEEEGGSTPLFNQKTTNYSHSIKKIIKNQDLLY